MVPGWQGLRLLLWGLDSPHCAVLPDMAAMAARRVRQEDERCGERAVARGTVENLKSISKVLTGSAITSPQGATAKLTAL